MLGHYSIRTFSACLFLLLAAFATKTVAQTDLYVDGSVGSSGSGGSWTAAFKTLTEALAVANPGTASGYRIHVAEGVYLPTATTKRDSSFRLLRGNIHIYGGYPAGGGTRNTLGHPTILSGNIGNPADSADNSFHVMLLLGLTASDTVTLSGLHFRDGQADSLGQLAQGTHRAPRNSGAGLAIVDSRSRVFVDSCRFTHNTAGTGTPAGRGAGLLRQNLAPLSGQRPMLVLRGCRFDMNAASEGSGLFMSTDGATDSLFNCSFSGNRSLAGGAACNMSLRSTATDSSNVNVVGCDMSGNIEGGLAIKVETFNYSGGGTAMLRDCSVNGNTGGGASFIVLADRNRPATLEAARCVFNNNSSTAFSGAGIRTHALGRNFTSARLRLMSCTISGNSSQLHGGGIANNADEVSTCVILISGCEISNNTAKGIGGGLYNFAQPRRAARSVYLDSCRITNNHADSAGGGMGNMNVWSTFRGIIVSGNTAGASAGVHIENCDPTFVSSLFTGNRALRGPGGAMGNYRASPDLTNCTFAGDTAAGGGAAMINIAPAGPFYSLPTVLNCIIWEGPGSIVNDTNTSFPTVTFSTVQGGITGTGNDTTDPHFVAPVPQQAAPTTAGDYRLLPCSPLIDLGKNVPIGLNDLDQNPRTFGNFIDRGPYEYQDTYPSLIIGDTVLCLGESSQLRPLTQGGTWSNRNPSVATLDASGMLQPVAPGVDTIFYAAPVGRCPNVAQRTVRVFAYPVLSGISGADTICAGTTSVFTNAGTGGVWSSRSSSLGSVDAAGRFSALAAGTDTIRYTVTNGGRCATMVEKAVTILAAPKVGPISGASLLCGPGATVELNDTTTGGSWSSADSGVILIDAGGLAQSLKNGTVAISYTVVNSEGCATSATHQLRAVIIDTGVNLNSMDLKANEAGGSYTWFDCNSGDSLGSAQVFTAPAGGAYKVVIARGGCIDSSGCIAVTGLGLKAQAFPDLKVYPNPAGAEVSVSAPNLKSGAVIRIIDGTGRVVRTAQVLHAGTQRLNLGRLAPGVYSLELVQGAQKAQRRLVILP